MQKEDKKQKIHDAALKLFAHYGYRKTTVEDVATTVGMTKSNIYFYFSNKRALYEQTVANALTNWRESVAAAAALKRAAVEKFIVMSTASFDYIARHEALQAVLMKDPAIFTLSPSEDRFSEVNRGAMKLIEDVLDQGIREGDFHKMDVKHATEFLFSIYIMFLIKTYVKSEGSSTAGIYTEGLTMIIRGLCRDGGEAMKLLDAGMPPMDVFNRRVS